MIRNVVLHINNEQPLMADLFDVPSPSDLGLLCTNMRGTDGRKPVFIDHIESVFFFPYRAIRFLEISPAELALHEAEGGGTRGRPAAAAPTPEAPVPDLRAYRVAEPGPAGMLPVHVPGAADEVTDVVEPEADHDGDIEIDEDFLRRIRDI